MRLFYICSLVPAVIKINQSAALINPHHFKIARSNLKYFTSQAPSSVPQAHLPQLITMAHNEKPLSELYESIIEQSLTMTKPWPDSDGFAKCCFNASTHEKNVDNHAMHGSFQVPVFPEGTGPLGVFALMRENVHPGNEKLVQNCLNFFDQFCDEFKELVPNELFVLVHSLVPHITVAIFQEHPRLLPKNEQNHSNEDFYYFTNEDGNMLAQSLANQTSHYPLIQLALHSLILTPDGAMIAGFLDVNENSDKNYGKLKMDIMTDAKRVMGMKDFTSRPKNLIHITCGRVVRKRGALLEPRTQATIQDLVRRYNKEVFPRLVADIKSSGTTATLWLDQLTVLRNDVWLCEKNTVYGVGKLRL